MLLTIRQRLLIPTEMERPTTSALLQTAIYGHWLKVESSYGAIRRPGKMTPLANIWRPKKLQKNTRFTYDRFFLRDRNRQRRSIVPSESKSASAFACDACVDYGRLCMTKLAAEQSTSCKAIYESRLMGKFKPGQLGLYVIEENRLRFKTEFEEKATNRE